MTERTPVIQQPFKRTCDLRDFDLGSLKPYGTITHRINQTGLSIIIGIIPDEKIRDLLKEYFSAPIEYVTSSCLSVMISLGDPRFLDALKQNLDGRFIDTDTKRAIICEIY